MRPLVIVLFVMLLGTTPGRSQNIENVRFSQRTDGSFLVDIAYDLMGGNGLPVDIRIEASDNGGETWDLAVTSLTGDVGPEVAVGPGKHVVWDFFADHPLVSGNRYRVRVTADQNLCGMTLTQDFTLTEDLVCPSGTGQPALSIGAPHVTLDLGGHTISGDLADGLIEGIIVDNSEGVTIRNGIIEGFSIGIVLSHSEDAELRDLLIRNLDIFDPSFPLGGIVATASHRVWIHDCRFEFLETHHKEAVVLGGTLGAVIDNIEMHGGSVGVNFGGENSTGVVVNSRFHVSAISGVLVQSTTNARIANNLFDRSTIAADPAKEGTVRGLTIEGNTIRDGSAGVQFRGGTESLITGNEITGCLTGISMERSRGCYGDTGGFEECHCAVGNVIRSNTVLGNKVDLSHDPLCTGNVWEGNTYETSEGIETYATGPATAGESIDLLHAAASNVAADAELVRVRTLEADTLGRSYKWEYIYRSVSRQEQYLFWYHNGKALARGTPQWPVEDNLLPIPGAWVDSDSAMVVIEASGGQAFRRRHEIQNIELALSNPAAVYWTTYYFAADSIYTGSVDAVWR